MPPKKRKAPEGCVEPPSTHSRVEELNARLEAAEKTILWMRSIMETLEDVPCIADNIPIPIFVRCLDGKTITVEVRRSMQVSDLKRIIAAREGQSCIEMQRLIFAGKQLSDNETLSSYNIKSENTLHLLVRMRGD